MPAPRRHRAPHPNAPQGTDDVDLLRRARAGDHEALTVLVSQVSADARRCARGLVPASDVDDVVADALVRILIALRNGNGPTTALAPYLRTTIRTVAWQHLRVRQRDKDKLRRLGPPPPAGPDPQDAHLEPRLADAFRALAPRHRLVLWWGEVEGHPPEHLAQLLGISPNAVAAVRHRARRALRARYSAASAESPA